jgi:hypothetical protein
VRSDCDTMADGKEMCLNRLKNEPHLCSCAGEEKLGWADPDQTKTNSDLHLGLWSAH